MKRLQITLSLIAIIVLSALGCTSTEQTTTNKPPDAATSKSLLSQFPKENLDSIGLHVYQADSIKAQPEFMHFLMSEEELQAIFSWLQKGVNKAANSKKIKKIYWLQFEYEIDKRVVDRKYLAYVQDENGQYYAKPFQVVKELYLEKFTEESIEPILQILGKDNWFVVEEAPF
ncbi:hypothetical protein [Brevibacillus borstelensis]|uniref:hypothetical protein n=1 Tax=Brevibacillus borstelensis TaxID=45462 RepID=UPI0030C4024F